MNESGKQLSRYRTLSLVDATSKKAVFIGERKPVKPLPPLKSLNPLNSLNPIEENCKNGSIINSYQFCLKTILTESSQLRNEFLREKTNDKNFYQRNKSQFDKFEEEINKLISDVQIDIIRSE